MVKKDWEKWVESEDPEIKHERLSAVIAELETAVNQLDAALASAKRVLAEIRTMRKNDAK